MSANVRRPGAAARRPPARSVRGTAWHDRVRGTVTGSLLWTIIVLLVVVAVVGGRSRVGSPAAPAARREFAPDRPLRSDARPGRCSVGLRGYRMDEVDDVLPAGADLEPGRAHRRPRAEVRRRAAEPRPPDRTEPRAASRAGAGRPEPRAGARRTEAEPARATTTCRSGPMIARRDRRTFGRRPRPTRTRRPGLTACDVGRDVDVSSTPRRAVWDVLVDWDGPGEWMLGTRMRRRRRRGRGCGRRLAAVTGVGPLGVHRHDAHRDRVGPAATAASSSTPATLVRGRGVFEVVPLADGRTRFIWSERLDLPFGRLGTARLAAGRPGWSAGGCVLAAPARAVRRGRSDAVPPTASWSARTGSAALRRGALSTPEYVRVPRQRVGPPVHGDDVLFERVTLEAFQSGLSWLTILRKRRGFRRGVRRLSIPRGGGVRRARRRAAARRRGHRPQPGQDRRRADERAARSLRCASRRPRRAGLVVRAPSARTRAAPGRWPTCRPTTPESVALAKELKRAGFVFVGPTTAYALMQACGMVDDHLAGCHVTRRRQRPPPLAGVGQAGVHEPVSGRAEPLGLDAEELGGTVARPRLRSSERGDRGR